MLGLGLWDSGTLAKWWKLTDEEKIALWPPYARYIQPPKLEVVSEPASYQAKAKKRSRKQRKR